LTRLAGSACDADTDALIELALLSALLAGFAYWIDRQNGRRIDDLRRSVNADVGRLYALITAVVPRAAASIEATARAVPGREPGESGDQRVDTQAPAA